MSYLFDLAFTRLDRALSRRREFADAWAAYIAPHPWNAELSAMSADTFEIRVRTDTPAPASLGLAFSDWLAALRAALDNGLYAWVAAETGQDPPPDAGKLQFPIATTPADFRNQSRRLANAPTYIVAALEKAQPYQSPYGPESNLLYWLHELARVDRHRRLHLGLGRVSGHRVQVGVPLGTTVTFDTSIQPYAPVNETLTIARFTTSQPLSASDIMFNPGVSIDPEIQEWASFELDGQRVSLHERMFRTEIHMRNHLENMAFFVNVTPPGGFRTFDPEDPSDDSVAAAVISADQ
ncbi:hypothetical protein [Nucisporomicrobium flavum]|uniref:hypothetical protein n=1 Tax=Nucisporomicrobium flavum TaxID=2785915 RepID=UPI0018F36BB1|nr:hypothetical protein [Nucisporomicrobium flavum]